MSVPWAHPIWHEYMVLLYDLHDLPGLPSAVRHMDGATHEMMVYAVDPHTPFDYQKSVFEQKGVTPLTPANHGYQFKAVSNQAAQDRVQQVLDKVLAGKLSPDTDFTTLWDHEFREDAVTLKNRTG